MINNTLKEFSEKLSSKDPTPGGGGACAYVGALSASLGQMVTNLTIGKKKYLDYTEELEILKNELEILRQQLNDDINNDAECFKPLAEAYKMDKEDPKYEETLEKCLLLAAKSPMNIFDKTKRVIEIDERIATIGSLISVSDAATSVMLASGTLYGAYINIKVNTRLMKDKEKAMDIENEYKVLLDEYQRRALACFNKIESRLNHD